MTPSDGNFQSRASRLHPHGIGLSVDVYSPNLFELVRTLDHTHLLPAYLEVFKAPDAVLRRLKKRYPFVPLEYHGEGLWITQPDMQDRYPFQEELATACAHLQALDSSWVNLECASKQMAGYSFGTYVPPLFSIESARVIANNARTLQAELDERPEWTYRTPPLLLLEIPPLPYWGFGDLPIPEFFERVVRDTPCGMVLDIGHLWTMYRYSEECPKRRPLRDFMADWLDRFPLDRVVEIHLAGLEASGEEGSQLSSGRGGDRELPPWLDAHHAPIPSVLFDLLDQVLEHPNLLHLKAVALEVDNKAQPLIISELRDFTARFQETVDRVVSRRGVPPHEESPRENMFPADARSRRASLSDVGGRVLTQYGSYVEVLSGKLDPMSFSLPLSHGSPGGVQRYREIYLVQEILEWGGDLRALFPETCRSLEERGVLLTGFVEYWFSKVSDCCQPYDFFLLKLERFCDFVGDMCPDLAGDARREAADMREAFRRSNEEVGV